MRELKPIFTTLTVALWVLWPLTAVAAVESFGASLAGMHLLSILMALMISSLSGLTALLHHMKKDLEQHGEIEYLALYISSKMLGSNVAGLTTLFWTTGQVNPNMQAGLIILAAFGGTWTLERALNYVADKIAPKKGRSRNG
jgi:hypothetical protein